jgi:hypothetical protein
MGSFRKKDRGRIAPCSPARQMAGPSAFRCAQDALRVAEVRKAVSVTLSLRADGLDRVLQGIVAESIAQMFYFVKWRVRVDGGCCNVGLAMLCSPAVAFGGYTKD